MSDMDQLSRAIMGLNRRQAQLALWLLAIDEDLDVAAAVTKAEKALPPDHRLDEDDTPATGG